MLHRLESNEGERSFLLKDQKLWPEKTKIDAKFSYFWLVRWLFPQYFTENIVIEH